jgi:hypothetical protein
VEDRTAHHAASITDSLRVFLRTQHHRRSADPRRVPHRVPRRLPANRRRPTTRKLWRWHESGSFYLYYFFSVLDCSLQYSIVS